MTNTESSDRQPTKSWIVWFLVLMLLSAGVRLLVLSTTEPVITPDTHEYFQIATAISHLDFSRDVGIRTPAYPLFILLFGSDPTPVSLAQLCLGLLNTAGLFLVTWQLTGNGVLSALTGASCGLSLGQIRFETRIVPETLVTFFLTLCVVIAVMVVLKKRRWSIAWLVILGLSASLAALTKPLFTVLPLVLMLAIIRVRHLRRELISFILPAFLPILTWSFYNHVRLGYFGLTTLLGFNLTNHIGGFIDYASPQYAVIRDTYIEARNAHGGDNHMVIWGIIDKLQERTGQSYPELSKTIEQMSLALCKEHPGLFLKSVARSWLEFLIARGEQVWTGGRDAVVSSIYAGVWRLERYLITGLNFCMFALMPFFFARQRRRIFADKEIIILTLTLIIAAAQMAQAVIESGDSARYGVPFQPLSGLLVLVTAHALLTKQDKRTRLEMSSSHSGGR